ncbi:Uncharacterised protein [Mycobacteroides abscessus]|nr:Uncharacterised protein [Mycobacteroides abscessus]
MEKDTSETRAILGACAIVSLVVSRAWAWAWAGLSLKVSNTCTGPSAPGPIATAAASMPRRISCDESNWRSMLLETCICRLGAASASRNIEAPSAESHGRRITCWVHLRQNGIECLRSGETRRNRDWLAAVLPKMASSAGISVVEVRTAMATTMMAPEAIDARAGVPIR